MSGTTDILAGYAGLKAGQEAFYKDLHRHPELSHQEHRTAGRAAERLQEYGFTVEAGTGGTGLAGVLANGDGPTVLLRAELDALRASPIPTGGIGFTAEKTYRAAAKAGRLEDLPANHSPRFLPPLQPTSRTGTEALTAAALAWLAP
jgi:hypothetical protein